MKTLIRVFSIIVMVSFTMVYFAADAGAETAFSPGIDYVSTNPAFIASGDLNNDTRTDLIVANWSSNTITVFLGNADGTFTAQTPVSTGGANAHPNSIATGYFNDDINLDLAVANGGGIRDVAVMLGDGFGGFSSVTSLDVSVGGYPATGDADINYIVSGDFDGDGETDLALSKNTGYEPTINDHIKIMKGDGSGGFTPLSVINVGNSSNGPYGITTGYFNNDLNLDLAVTMYDGGTLKILLGDGSGGFTEASGSPITVGTIPSRIINADLNGDGEADLIVTNYTSNTVSVLLGNGDGTFTSASGSPVSTGAGPNGLAAALIDADGIPDLIVANTGASTFSVFAGNGDGTFQARKDFATGTGPGFLVARDFDGDGKTDLAIAHSSTNKVSVYLQTECTPSPSGMVAWWPGDGSALDVIGTNNGTLMNGATYASGIVGQAFSFDGVNDYVSVPHSSAWNFGSNNFTIDLWVKFNAIKSNFLACHDEGVGNQNKWCFYADHDYLNFHINSPGTGPISIGYGTVPFPYNTGQWYHLALTRNGNTYTFYVDGAPAGTVTDSNVIPDANAPLTIGQGEGTHYVNGLIDELEIFNRALSASDIAAIYNAGTAGKCRTCAAQPANMVAWWKGDGNTADAVGTNHGTLQGGAAYASGMVGQAFSLTGTGDYVDAGTSNDFNFNNGTGDFTIDAWINLTAHRPTGSNILNKHTFNPFSGWGLYIYTDGKLGFGGVGVWEFASAVGTITTGNWAHVAVTKQGSAYRMYKNGLEIASRTYGNLQTSSAPLKIGSDFNGLNENGEWSDNRFNGLIDEVEIFNRALSASEIAAIYNAGNTGKCFTADTTPGTITFDPVTGAAISSLYTSNTITISGINVPAEITITGGAYSVGCTATFISTPSTVVNGNTVCVQQTSSPNYSTPKTATLTIGQGSGDFNVTTMASHMLNAVAVPSEAKTFNPSSWEIGEGGNIGINIEPNAAYYFVSATDNCGAGGSAIGTLYDSNRSYSISPMTVDCTVTVTYAPYPVWRDGTLEYFMTIGGAYGTGTTSYTIKAHGVELTDSNLNLAGTAAVVIDGGYLADFGGYSGILTTITGPLTISAAGSVTLSNIEVK